MNDSKTSKLPLTVLNTNARSLASKLNSLVDCFNETDARIATVTETWFRSGEELDRMVQDLSLGEGIGMLCKNRPPAANGVSYGGVAVLWKESLCAFKRIELRLSLIHI